MAQLPLQNIRVLDISRILAGPWASQMLGDLGAEVIKIEHPRKGDDARQFGPPFLTDKEGRNTQESSFFLSVNRNKKSLTVDISTAEGQDIIRRLAKNSDVLLENYKVGGLKRYGLDYESLSAVNPKLIYASLTGFGQTGPYASKPGYDSVFQAMSGLMSVTGLPDGVPGGGPMKTGPSLADIIAGQYMVTGIIAALYHRDNNGGSGQHIDLSLLDSMIAANSHYASHYLVSGDVPVRRGTEGNGGMPSRLFQCEDAAIVVVAGNDEQYARMCHVLGHPELADDKRFATNVLRVTNRAELARVFEPLFACRKSAELLAAFDRAGVPAGPVYNFREVFEDAHTKARGMCVEIDHPLSGSGKINIVANPLKFSETPITDYSTPPQRGQHNKEVLGELLGLSEDELKILTQRSVI